MRQLSVRGFHTLKVCAGRMRIRMSMIRIGFAVPILLWAPLALSTVQIPDLIIVDGEERQLYGPAGSLPFEELLRHRPEIKRRLAFYPTEICSAAWSGFRATWSLKDDKLLLIKLISDPCSKESEVPLRLVFFPEKPPIAATWFSGTLVVMPDESHGAELVIEIQNGVAVRFATKVLSDR
jgi:hypothetical protein